MAKKVAKTDKTKDVIDSIKDSIYLSAEHILTLERTLIPWSPAFDSILGGGVISGSMTNIAGSPKTGKTSSALCLCAQAQKPELGGRYWRDKGRPIIFYNIENRLTKRDLLGVPGLDLEPDRFMLAMNTDKKTWYLEDYFEDIERAIDLYPGCIILLDSIGALCTKKVASATDGDQVRDPAPILSSQFMKKIGAQLMAKDIIMLNILHKVTNSAAKPGQSTTMITGGIKVKFGANNYFEVKWAETSDNDKDGLILHLGGKTTSEVGTPDEEATAYLRFGRGLWNSYELINLCVQPDTNNLFNIGKSGAWYIVGEKKIQGILNAATYLDETPELYSEIYANYASSFWKNRKLYV
jgi:RecA/RadA recombinase